MVLVFVLGGGWRVWWLGGEVKFMVWKDKKKKSLLERGETVFS